MRNTIFRIFLVLIAVFAPLPVLAQQPTPTGGRPLVGRGPGPQSALRIPDDGPIKLLLENRVVLSLSGEQVGQLEEIDRQMREANRPIYAQLFAMRQQMPRVSERDMTPEQREAYQATLRTAEPLLAKIRKTNMVCMTRVGEILTDDQEARVRVLIDNQDRRDNGGRGPGRSGNDRQ